MSTHCRIGFIAKDGAIESIYCHFDGYLSGTGDQLLQRFTSTEKVRELLKLGSLDSIGFRGKKPKRMDEIDREDNVCSSRLSDHTGEEFTYLYSTFHRKRGKWLYIDRHGSGLIPLTKTRIMYHPFG